MVRIRRLASAALLLGIAAGGGRAVAQERFANVPAVSPSSTAPAHPAAPATNPAPAAIPVAPPARVVPTTRAAPAAAPAATRAAMNPEEAWNVLFAKEAAALGSNATKHECAQFAARILGAAKEVPGDLPVQALLCNKAYEFGIMGPEGYASASAAMELLAQQPPLKSAADDKVLSLYELMWKAAYGERRRTVAAAYVEKAEDAADTLIQAGKLDKALVILRNAISASEVLSGDAKVSFQLHLKDANHKAALAKHAAELKAAAELGVSRAKFAQELVDLLLVEMDTPAEATAYAALAGDPAVVRRVEQAKKKPAELGESELLELAGWYEKKLEMADDYAQYQTFPHALGLLTQFMEIHETEDVLRLKAKLSWEQMQKKYQRAAAAVAPRHVVDLMALIDPAKDTVNGTWKVSSGHLVGTVTERLATVLLPYQPPAEYDLRVDFRRVEGNEALVLAAVQNGKRFAWMIAAYSNTICAMETPDGGKPKNNSAVYQPAGGVLKNGTDHSLVLKVRKTGLALTLDGTLIGQHPTDGSDLGAVRPHWNPIAPLGIILHSKQYDFARLELTEVTGTGKKWDLPGAPATAPAKPGR